MVGRIGISIVLPVLAMTAFAGRDCLAQGPHPGASPAAAPPASVANPTVWIPGAGPNYPSPWLPGSASAPLNAPTNPPGNTNMNPGNLLPSQQTEVGNIFEPREARPPSDLSADERKSLELACGNPAVQGAAAYRQCAVGQINLLRAAGQRPNLNVLTPSERSSVELACVDAKRQGPTLYNHCRAVHAQGAHR